MANQNITMPIDIKQDNNALSSSYGKWFARVHRLGTLSTEGLAQHMAKHGSLCTEEVLGLVLKQLSKCVPELLAMGVPVKLDGLGIFYPTVENVKMGAASVAEASQMGAEGLVKGVHIRFQPEGSDLRDITSRSFKKKCELRLENVVAISLVTAEVDGEEVVTRRLQKSRPISDYLAAEAQFGDGWSNGGTPSNDGGNGGDGGDGGDDDDEPTIRP